MSGTPKSHSTRSALTEHEIAYGGRPLGRRSRHSSRGSHAPPGGPGKPDTGRRAAGDRDEQDREVSEMQTAETVLAIIHDRGRRRLPLEDKPLVARFGGIELRW